MHLLIRATHIVLSEKQQEYLEKKMKKLERFAVRLSDESSKCHIDVSTQRIKTSGERITMKAQVHLPHDNFHVEMHAERFEEAVDLLFEKLEGHIARYKERIQEHGSIHSQRRQ